MRLGGAGSPRGRRGEVYHDDRMRLFSLVLVLALAGVIAACSSSSSSSPYGSSAKTSPASVASSASPVPTVVFGATTITYPSRDDPGATIVIDTEVASTPSQSERGLGYRDSLPAGAGMIFDLHNAGVPTFWMKGMRFALDMVWIGDDKRVASVTTDIPPEPGVVDEKLTRYSPQSPARYVLELNAGAAARLGLTPSTQLTFALPQ